VVGGRSRRFRRRGPICPKFIITFVIFAGFGAVYIRMSFVIRKHLKRNARSSRRVTGGKHPFGAGGSRGIRDVNHYDTQPYFLCRFGELDRHLQRANAMNARRSRSSTLDDRGHGGHRTLAYF